MLDVNYDARLARLLLPHISDFMLIDVGASGGIHPLWGQLEPALRAHGFEPDENEVDRLNTLQANDRVRYHAAFVTSTDEMVAEGKRTDGLFNTHCFELTSARRAATAFGRRAQGVSGAASPAPRFSERKISVDSFCETAGVAQVDFIKIDTDGDDYYVLRGAERTLHDRGVLGVQVECPLHGTPHALANVFSNIDQFMRQMGFALFSTDVWRYSRAGLPAPFFYDIPAQTRTGQVQWLDALYVLDPLTRRELFETLDRAQLVKVLMLYDLFGLPDCAATLIMEMRRRGLALAGVEFNEALDLLAPGGDHEAYLARFDEDPAAFYPSNLKR
jgi:FkbM family methyltransferase